MRRVLVGVDAARVFLVELTTTIVLESDGHKYTAVDGQRSGGCDASRS